MIPGASRGFSSRDSEIAASLFLPSRFFDSYSTTIRRVSDLEAVARRLNEFRDFLSAGHSVIGNRVPAGILVVFIGETIGVDVASTGGRTAGGADRCFC